MEKNFEEAVDFRHACKVFDETKKISQNDLRFILEAGIKSPSSFGMEAWKFLVITNEELKAKLRPVCWNQVQITSCSHLVVLLCDIKGANPESGVPKQRLSRRDYPQEKIDMYVDLYSNFLKNNGIVNDKDFYAWTAKQSYLAAAYMMIAAATKGIDSCPIEGFEKDKVEEILELDTTTYQVSLILPFGYRVNEQPTQIRDSFENIIEFIN